MGLWVLFRLCGVQVPVTISVLQKMVGHNSEPHWGDSHSQNHEHINAFGFEVTGACFWRSRGGFLFWYHGFIVGSKSDHAFAPSGFCRFQSYFPIPNLTLRPSTQRSARRMAPWIQARRLKLGFLTLTSNRATTP